MKCMWSFRKIGFLCKIYQYIKHRLSMTVIYIVLKGRNEMLYLTTHSTHFIYGYIVRHLVKDNSDSERETRFRHMDYSFRLAARVLLYAPSHRQDSTYHGLWYTSRGALAGTRNSSMGPSWGIDPTTHSNMSGRFTTELHLAPLWKEHNHVR